MVGVTGTDRVVMVPGKEAGYTAALSSLVISERALAGIDRLLRKLVVDANATAAILLDRSGQAISASGDLQDDKVVVLGALLAGHFASAREIARLLGESTFRMCFQQGERERIMTLLVGERCLLSIVFDKRTQLGLVKLLSVRAADEMAVIVEASIQQGGTGGVDLRRLHGMLERQVDGRLREVGED